MTKTLKLLTCYYDYARPYFFSYFYVTDQDSKIQTVNTHHHVMQPLSKNSVFAAYKPLKSLSSSGHKNTFELISNKTKPF